MHRTVVCTHMRAVRPPQKNRPRKRRTDDTKSHQSTPSKKFIVNTSTGAAGKSLARKKKKEQRAKNKEEKRVKREADDAEFEKLIIAEHNELLNCDGKRDEPTENNTKNNKIMHVRVHDVPKRTSSDDVESRHIVRSATASSSSVAGDTDNHGRLHLHSAAS